jgi:hypothetical protein
VALHYLLAALTLAHRARCAAAIFFRAAADIVFFFGMLTTFCFCPPFPRASAQRALLALGSFLRESIFERLDTGDGAEPTSSVRTE